MEAGLRAEGARTRRRVAGARKAVQAEGQRRRVAPAWRQPGEALLDPEQRVRVVRQIVVEQHEVRRPPRLRARKGPRRRQCPKSLGAGPAVGLRRHLPQQRVRRRRSRGYRPHAQVAPLVLLRSAEHNGVRWPDLTVPRREGVA